MRLFVIIASLLASSAAAAQSMCFDREYGDDIRFDVEVGWAAANPLDPTPDPVTASVDQEKLITALRDLKGGWNTPSTIWPKSAVQIEIYQRGLLRCQAIYTRDEIYSMDRDANGFLIRPLAVAEYFALNDALAIPSYVEKK